MSGFKFIRHYFGMSGCFKGTTIKATLESKLDYNSKVAMWSDIKTWKQYEYKFGLEKSDLNYAALHLCKLKSFLFKNYSKGFYVYAEPKKFKDLKSGVEYVTRYCGRVPISENRIVNYDGSNVTFSYIDHKDNKYQEITLSASQFIMVLLRHLLPTQFKIIRYYGFYRKNILYTIK